MNFKKFLALLLALSMIICALAACSSGGDDDDDDDEKQEEKEGEEADLGDLGNLIGSIGNDSGNSDSSQPVERPDQDATVTDPQYPNADYSGNEFTFLVIKYSDVIKDYYGGPYIDSEAINGNKINDAVFNRNLAVEQRYNVEINERVEVGQDPSDVLGAYFRSGDFCFDAIYGWGYKMGACIPENYFADMASLPNVDLTKDYWAPSAVEDLMINGKLYIAANDISMNRLDWANMLYFNKNTYEDFKIEASFGNIYDLVRSGKWTLDTFLNMVKSVSRDLDGVSGISKDDVFGLIDGSADGSAYLSALGVNLTTGTDDGFQELTVYNEKTLDIMNKIYPVFSNNSYVKSYNEIIYSADDISGYDDQYQYARSVFTTDHALFLSGAPNLASETAFRNMESEYGIVPMPKYDENQANYVSEVSSLASVFAIPSTVRSDIGSMERTGMILEYMAFKSNEIVRPVYYDEILKGQSPSGNDAQMLDIIWNTTHYEISSVCIASDSPNSLSPYALAQRMFQQPRSAASTYNSQKTKVQKELNDYFKKVAQLP